MVKRTNILLSLDESCGEVKKQMEIAQQLSTTPATICNVSRRYFEEGLRAAIKRRPRQRLSIQPIATGDIEARIIALACSEPPKGRSRWTLRLLEAKVVELQIVPSISVLDGSRNPIPMKPGDVARYDSEYIGHGTCSIFVFTEPLKGWRHVSVSERRTKKDWAEHVAELLDVHYPNAPKVCLVMDNLNTHAISSLYEAFPADRARAYARRLEIHFTPLNKAIRDSGDNVDSVLPTSFAYA